MFTVIVLKFFVQTTVKRGRSLIPRPPLPSLNWKLEFTCPTNVGLQPIQHRPLPNRPIPPYYRLQPMNWPPTSRLGFFFQRREIVTPEGSRSAARVTPISGKKKPLIAIFS